MESRDPSTAAASDKETSVKSKRLNLPVAIKAREQETPTSESHQPDQTPAALICGTGSPQIMNLSPSPSSRPGRDWTFNPRILQSGAGKFRLEP